LERFPETVLERIIGPVSVAIMRLSTAVRRLQHGRLQFYILYVLAGLIALGVLAMWGGAQ
jgi:hydrogenase-4 component B